MWFLTIGDRHPDTFYGQHVKTCGTSQAKGFSFRWLRALSKADSPLVIYLREKKTYESSSGILLSVSSLPSPYGIGTLGKAAYDFADFLRDAGQTYWQMLPLGPTSYGDSPYQSFSTFAGNPYFIDLDLLIRDGLLTENEVKNCLWGTEPRYVDYGKIYESRFTLLQKTKERGWQRDEKEVAAFVKENQRWLTDYTRFSTHRFQLAHKIVEVFFGFTAAWPSAPLSSGTIVSKNSNKRAEYIFCAIEMSESKGSICLNI